MTTAGANVRVLIRIGALLQIAEVRGDDADKGVLGEVDETVAERRRHLARREVTLDKFEVRCAACDVGERDIDGGDARVVGDREDDVAVFVERVGDLRRPLVEIADVLFALTEDEAREGTAARELHFEAANALSIDVEALEGVVAFIDGVHRRNEHAARPVRAHRGGLVGVDVQQA